ncbi:MAG: flagellar biosynthetic protein FliR [Betaproteobacteria bacterium]|jgi:flagellar biosynthesis protein FliR|nr:flagellar biosynthetic protein FliR [Betaproteobacteria bacterium]
MNLLAADIVERFYTFLWPMLRISALMITAPLFSMSAFSVRLRVVFAMVLAWFVYPLHKWPLVDPVSAQGLVEVFNQIAIGSLMGLMLQVVVAALVVAGQAISASMGLSMASLLDPNMGNVPVLAQFFTVLAMLIFVGFGGHAILLGIVSDSFTSMPIGTSILSQQSFGELLRWSSMMFLGAVLLSLPVMVTLLFINMGLGIITRAAPSLNIFAVGLPAMIITGFVILVISMESIGGRMEWLWVQGFSHLRTLVGVRGG